MKRIMVFIIACMMLLVPVHAESPDGSSVMRVGGCTFVGEYADKLSVKVDNDNFFRIDMMGPGDQWQSHINVKNIGKKDIEISLRKITDNLNNKHLLDALDLTITKGKETVYKGKFSKTEEKKTIMDWTKLKAGDEFTLIIDLLFPPECGNGYQATMFDTDWIFEVRAEEPTPTPTPTPKPTLTPTPTTTPAPTQTPTITPTPAPTGTVQITPTPNPTNDTNDHKNDNVQTGDTSPVIPLLIVCAVSLVVLFVFMKKKEKGEGHE